MAKFEVNIPTDLMKNLDKLYNTDAMIKELLESEDVSRPLIDSFVGELQNHKDTGALIGSVKKLVKKNKYGWFMVVRPTGKDKKGVRNMEKLMTLEFGSKTQPARPLVDRATKNAESAVIQALERKLNDYIS